MTTIGERLEDARKKKGISIREAAESTKIRGDYLQKFESNLFDIGLTEIYTRGFLRTYATFLRLPADRILNDYTALGHGDARPRQPSREVYGRMDLSIASADERSAPPEESSAGEPARAQPHFPRTRSNLPATPAIDPALLMKLLKYGVAAVVVLLLVWGGIAIFSRKSPALATTPARTVSPDATAKATPPTGTNTAVITALEVVRVQVWQVLANARTPAESYGPVLLEPTTLLRGESRTVPRNGPLYIYASAQENLQIDTGGTRIFPREHGRKGADTFTLNEQK